MDVTNENLYIVKSGQRQTTTRLSTQLTTRTVFAPGHIYTHNTRTACNTAVPCVPSGLACLHRRDRGKLVGIFQGRRDAKAAGWPGSRHVCRLSPRGQRADPRGLRTTYTCAGHATEHGHRGQTWPHPPYIRMITRPTWRSTHLQSIGCAVFLDAFEAPPPPPPPSPRHSCRRGRCRARRESMLPRTPAPWM